MTRFATRIAALSGWRRYGLAFALGATVTLTLPPLYLFPLNFLIFPLLIWLVSGATRRRTAFAIGWWFGFGFFGFGLYWIGNALLVFSAKFAWLLPFASTGLPAFLAIFCGGATIAAWYGKTPLQRALLLALGWTTSEWLRGHILTGFPWNLLGYSWTGSEAMVQSTALFGIYGLSLAVVISACLPAALAGPAVRRRYAVISLAIPLIVWTGGAVRLGIASPVEFVDKVGLRIVQSNIPQREKWAREFQQRNLRLFLDLTVKDRPDWITHVIWPETAATFFVAQNDGMRRILAGAVPQGGLLLTGAPRRGADTGRLTNAMIAINDTGRVVGTYDKFHLVPFGEYVPFADYLPIDKLTHGSTGFLPGPGPQSLSLPGLPIVSPLVCYEVIFPGNVVSAGERPGWLLNLTNDAWYGLSAGPHQHLAQARVRAVEEGLPLIRAAYTGISAVVDPYGRVLQQRALNDAGVIDSKLPQPLATPPPYANWGDFAFAAMFVLVIVILLPLMRNNLQPKEQ
ncbi:MAG: apolipoprotein N-acyltransferase [Alphaproteobacteria bacterium]|nr:apolipoprotein N-acyltransferase [Alphaproteobacteria bacterium]